MMILFMLYAPGIQTAQKLDREKLKDGIQKVSDRIIEEKIPAVWIDPLIDTHASWWFYFNAASLPSGIFNLNMNTQSNKFNKRILELLRVKM